MRDCLCKSPGIQPLFWETHERHGFRDISGSVPFCLSSLCFCIWKVASEQVSLDNKKDYTFLYSPYLKSDRRGSNPRSRPWQGRALPTTPLSHLYVLLTEAATKCIIRDDEGFVNPFRKFFCIFLFSKTILFFSTSHTIFARLLNFPLRRLPAERGAPAWRKRSRSNPGGKGRILWIALWSACSHSAS